MNSSFIVTHPEWGIFLGAAMGLAFWSELESAGQDSACTFGSEADAKAFIAEWPQEVSLWCAIKPITTAEPGFATVTELIAAGFKGWINENTPTAGPLQ